MISAWLGLTPRQQFLAEHFHRAPFASQGGARSAVPYLEWDTIARLVSARPRPDVLVARSGSLQDGREPGSTEDFVALLQDGCSVVVRHAERFDRRLAELAQTVAAEFAGDVTVHLFATPAGCHGFGWHYDCEDVFLAQTSGEKEYFLRRNTVNPEPTIDVMPKDMQFERETSPTMACTMVRGDWLYIPRGWWHVARAKEHSLAISIGLLTPEARGRSNASTASPPPDTARTPR